MFCCTIPAKPGKNAFARRNNTKWLSTLNYFFLNICLTFRSPPEQSVTPSMGLKWPRLNKLVAAPAIPTCSYRRKEPPCCCQASFLCHELLLPTSFVYWSISDAAAAQNIKVVWVLGWHKMKQEHFNRSLSSQEILQPFTDSEYFTAFKDIKYFMSLTQFNINELLAPFSFLKGETAFFFFSKRLIWKQKEQHSKEKSNAPFWGQGIFF